jgi:hypothetical protein
MTMYVTSGASGRGLLNSRQTTGVKAEDTQRYTA